MLMDPCELSPSYVRSIAPYQPGKPISELARELGLKEREHRQARLQREPARHRPAHARRDRGGARRHRALPGRQRLRAEAGARRSATASTWASIVLGNGSNDVLELVGARVPRAGARGGATRSTASRSTRSPRRRAARAASWCRRRTTATTSRRWRRRSTTKPTWSGSPTRTIRPAPSRAARSSKPSCKRVPERVLVVLDEAYNEYLPPELRGRHASKWLKRHPEPGRHAHVLQGLRPRRAARRLRARASRRSPT